MSKTPDTSEFTGTMPVQERHRFDEEKLLAYLESSIPDFQGPLTVSQFKGGQSNPTYKLHTGNRDYVLRRKPPGKLLASAHAVDREYRVISALADTDVPVARSYCLCEDDSVIGTPFYVMDCMDGRILWEPTLPGMTPDERGAIFDEMNRVIAALHAVDYRAVGLADYGKPGNYFARQINRWTKQYKASETESIEAMEKLMAWLPENIPGGDDTTIVHGDYRLDNMVFHPDKPEVIAVLDWELSTLGHPLADFSYHCMPWYSPTELRGLGGADLASLGIPSLEDYRNRYFERSGRPPVSEQDWAFYIAYNNFRMAGILQGIMGRVKDGTAASKQAETMGALARPTAELGLSLLQEHFSL